MLPCRSHANDGCGQRGAIANGTTSPMPVIITGWRTPGSALAIDGAPHNIPSTCTNPNDSVEFRLGNT